MAENIVTGKKLRLLTDAANDLWDRVSLWTKASDVHYDDGTTAEDNRPINVLKRNTYYSSGIIVYEPTAPSYLMLRCITSGTTATTTPSGYASMSYGSSVTDGTARFQAYDVRPVSSNSSSSYQIPSANLVNTLNNQLTASGTPFYFDVQNGVYGYNTSSSRGSSTFHPFGGSSFNFKELYLQYHTGGSNAHLILKSNGTLYYASTSSATASASTISSYSDCFTIASTANVTNRTSGYFNVFGDAVSSSVKNTDLTSRTYYSSGTKLSDYATWGTSRFRCFIAY